ncbi:MAG: thioredoxin family protein [Candidatus Altiarchaeota archaeon]
MRPLAASSIALLLIAASTPVFASSQQQNGTVTLTLFWREGCAHCEEEKEFLTGLKDRYPSLVVNEYEIGDEPNRALYEEYGRRYNATPSFVPGTFIGDTFILGYNNEYLIGRDIEERIKCEILLQTDGTACTPRPRMDLPILGKIDYDIAAYLAAAFAIIAAGTWYLWNERIKKK